MNPPASTATFWFDASCPFTWRTSRWLAAAAAARGMSIDWRLMSLGILNEGNENVPDQYRARFAEGARVLAVLAAVRLTHGPAVLARVYTEHGTRVHEEGAPSDLDTLAGALAASDLPDDLLEAADDDQMRDAVRVSHQEAQDKVGTATGSPVTALGHGPGFFGPVVVPPPFGDEGLRLLDALSLLSEVPSFSELKRVRAPF